MKTVVHIISDFGLGGSQVVAFTIASGGNQNIKYHIVEVFKSDGKYREDFISSCSQSKIQIHFSKISNKKMAILLFPFWFAGIVRKIKPDVIHTHTEIPDLSLFLYAHLFFLCCRRIKIVRTVHNTQLWNSWKWIGRVVERYFKKKDACIAVSQAVQQSYLNNYRYKCPVIYNGLSPVEQKCFEGVVQGKINILFAGRLEYQKGPDVLAAIVRMIDNENIHFHIVGDGSLKSQLLSGISECNNFTYYSAISDLSSYISSFDFVIMPSLFEGLGLLSLEASFAKVPCIINNCPGLNETLPDDWPLKVNGNSLDAYYSILSGIEMNSDLGQVAYEYVEKKFSKERMREQYESRYLK